MFRVLYNDQSILIFFIKGKEYRINLKTKNCTMSALTRPFMEFGIPKDARYVGTANVGPVNIPDEHAVIISFEGEDQREGGK